MLLALLLLLLSYMQVGFCIIELKARINTAFVKFRNVIIHVTINLMGGNNILCTYNKICSITVHVVFRLNLICLDLECWILLPCAMGSFKS